MFHDDIPLNKVSEDALGRSNLSRMITTYLKDSLTKNHPCRCIGIYGKWGEGKTSLLNFIREDLENHQNLKIINYNPWIVSGQEALIKEFFSLLHSSVADSTKELITKYGKVLSFSAKTIVNYIAPGCGDWVGGGLESLCDVVNNYETSLLDQKKAISKEFVKSETHLLVMIDDIDRLDNEETHALFRLVRQVADFENTTYILAMDPDIVSKSLSTYCGQGNCEDGRRFLEKIVQIPIQLPAIQERILSDILREKLAMLFLQHQCDQFVDAERLCNKIGGVFSTIRQVNRYINQLNFVLPAVKQEVNIEDLCLLESIKTIDVQAYLQINSCKSALLKEHDYLYAHINQKAEEKQVQNRYDEALGSITKGLNAEESVKIKKIVNTLFGDRIGINSFAQPLRDAKNICTSTYFNLYFIQAVPQGVISNTIINAVYAGFNSLSDTDLGIWIKKFIVEYDEGEMQRAIISILELEKDLQKRSLMTSTIIEVLSMSTLANEYEHSSIVPGNDLCTFVNSVLIKDYMVNGRSDNYYPSYDISLIEDTLKYVYSNSKLAFALSINAVLSKFDHLGCCSVMRKEYFMPLVDRFSALKLEEQLSYRKLLLVQFFFVWQYYDKTAPQRFLSAALNDESFEIKSFVEHFIDCDSEEHLGQDLQDFMTLFADSIPLMLEKYRKDNPEEVFPALKYVKAYYDTIMKNNKEREKEREL